MGSCLLVDPMTDLHGDCASPLRRTSRIAATSSGVAKRVLYPLQSTRCMRNEVANAAICDGGENESRILGTVSTESASVSVAQNDLALPQAWCSSTASTGDCD
jgi:hypothetical protein